MDSKAFAFFHVNIIPMTGDHVLYDQIVIVKDDRIAEIGTNASVKVPVDAIQIEAANQFLIPALSDMHVHLEGDGWNIMFPPEHQFSDDDLNFEEILFPYLANGITTIQVMSALPEHIALRDRINRGKMLGPQLILNRMIDGLGQSWPSPINTQVATREEAHQVVVESKEAGYDGIKVYSFLDQDCYDTILTTAQELGMSVSGHIPDALSLEYVLASGHDLIAHAEEVMKQARGDYSPEKIEYFAELIANSNTWITPTLTTSRKILATFDDLESELSRPEMRYLHPMAKGIWSFITENMYFKMPMEHRQVIHKGFQEFQIPFTKAIHDKGVKIMTGTDVLIPTNLPGFSLHDELEELVGVGLSPYDALRAATVLPKEYMGELENSGTIKVGKRADLVLLEENPLENIENTRTVIGILCGGNWLNMEKIHTRKANLYNL